MKHIILGSGRLGKALFKVLSADTENQTVMYSMRASGFTSPDKVSRLLVRHGLEDAVVWNCIGFGSIKECKEDPEGADIAHVVIPMAINHVVKVAGATAIHFSSDYALQPNLSAYAKSKKRMEELCHRDSIVIRVSSLHTVEDPLDGIIGKIVQNYMKDVNTPIGCSENMVYPTPVEWLSTILSWTNVWELKNGVYKAIPHGDKAIDVARYVLPEGAVAPIVTLDLERPMAYEEVEPYDFAHDILPKGHRYHWRTLLGSFAPDLYERASFRVANFKHRKEFMEMVKPTELERVQEAFERHLDSQSLS